MMMSEQAICHVGLSGRVSMEEEVQNFTAPFTPQVFGYTLLCLVPAQMPSFSSNMR